MVALVDIAKIQHSAASSQKCKMQLMLAGEAPITFSFKQRADLEETVQLLLQIREGQYDIQSKEAAQLKIDEEEAKLHPNLKLPTGSTVSRGQVAQQIAEKEAESRQRLKQRQGQLLQANPLLAEICKELVNSKSVRLDDIWKPFQEELGVESQAALLEMLRAQQRGIPSSLSAEITVQQLTSGEVSFLCRHRDEYSCF